MVAVLISLKASIALIKFVLLCIPQFPQNLNSQNGVLKLFVAGNLACFKSIVF